VNWYVPHIDSNIEAEARIVGHFPTVTDLTTLDRGPDKLLLISPTEDSATVQALAANIPAGLQAQVSKPTYLEVTRTGVDKASAVIRQCQAQGIRAAEMLAVGDGPNDCTLFAIAGMSVAPANAPPEVRAAADFVTLSNDEDGVALALDMIVSSM
jgi:hydroxymethylpyrimidine pyrophosphatase-like HAD family hydrolase